MPWSEVTEALDAFRAHCPSPLPITIEMHEAAFKIASSTATASMTRWSLPLRWRMLDAQLSIPKTFALARRSMGN
jgi:hypothetical protein